MTPQEKIQTMLNLKESIKNSRELLEECMEHFVGEFGKDNEFPIEVEGKTKWFRIYEPEGRFVYNTKFDMGLRANPKKPIDG